jgi:hypothetical protein
MRRMTARSGSVGRSMPTAKERRSTWRGGDRVERRRCVKDAEAEAGEEEAEEEAVAGGEGEGGGGRAGQRLAGSEGGEREEAGWSGCAMGAWQRKMRLACICREAEKERR